jgi:hypothetical protein
MSKILDNAKSHFKELLSAGLRGPIHVPEWDANIYYKPATSFNQESKIIELTSQGKQVEALVTALIMRALDADAKPLFNKADQPDLMRAVDPNVIMRVMAEMNDPESKEAAEEALKN